MNSLLFSNNKLFWFLSVGVWTPSILWPTEFLKNFRFDSNNLIAGDLELFFFNKNQFPNNLKYINDPIINMDSGGLSQNNSGSFEYAKIYNKYFLLKIGILGHYLRIIIKLFKMILRKLLLRNL